MFQDNCIEKIENLGRLRNLVYLNLAMNNIEFIENLEPLEKLEKLDLTLNFVGALSTVQHLKRNTHLRSFFLMGNPCTSFECYRDYVVAHLPQIQFLDGVPVEKSERISALQTLHSCIEAVVQRQEEEYLIKRAADKIQNAQEVREKSKEYDNPALDLDEQRQKFYQSQSKHNPEYRRESMRFRQYLEEMENKGQAEEEKVKKKTHRRLFDDQGRALNMNEANVDFRYDDSEAGNLRIEVFTYRYLDSSFIQLDVQPTYLR